MCDAPWPRCKKRAERGGREREGQRDGGAAAQRAAEQENGDAGDRSLQSREAAFVWFSGVF